MKQRISDELVVLHKATVPESRCFQEARSIAIDLLKFMTSSEIKARIAEKHKLNGKSQEIQNILWERASLLGFESEKKELFKEYECKYLRPDLFRALSPASGILLEVERGRTTSNNMDILDLWKCHICSHTNFLFLVVPFARESENGKSLGHFRAVQQRLSPFFEERNYVNVDAVFVFGY